jgi:hypothetical protein
MRRDHRASIFWGRDVADLMTDFPTMDPVFITQAFGDAAHCTDACQMVCIDAQWTQFGKAKVVILHQERRISIEWHAHLLKQAWLDAVRPYHQAMVCDSDWPVF